MNHEFTEVIKDSDRRMVDDFEPLDILTNYPESLVAFQNQIAEVLQEIPEQYRENVKILFDVDEDYGDFSVKGKLIFKRYETDEEVTDRLLFEDIAKEAEIKKAYQILEKYGRKL